MQLVTGYVALEESSGTVHPQEFAEEPAEDAWQQGHVVQAVQSCLLSILHVLNSSRGIPRSGCGKRVATQ